MDLKVVPLAGGVGGAKLADGLAGCLDPQNLTVIVNTADDFIHLGLHISPDVDTVTYTLAGLASPETGWGRADESWAFMETMELLGGPIWFRLGDRDLALHHFRSSRLTEGAELSGITREIGERIGVRARIIPMSDDPVRTIVITDEGRLSFQEYFVARRCEPSVEGFLFDGIETAKPAPGVLEMIEQSDVVVFCPSNPWVSLDPILSVEGIRQKIAAKPTFMVSPIIGEKTVKGPAAKMYAELGIKPSALAVATHYAELLTGIMIDEADDHLVDDIEAMAMHVRLDQILMKDREDRIRLASALLEFAHAAALKEQHS